MMASSGATDDPPQTAASGSDAVMEAAAAAVWPRDVTTLSYSDAVVPGSFPSALEH